MFVVGEIVQIYAPSAGKTKYHLCVCLANAAGVTRFLFMNSGSGYEGDFILKDAEVPCLPPSPTGESVISCSMVVRYSEKQLALYKAQSLGMLDDALLFQLKEFLRASTVLSKEERGPIVASLFDALSEK